jgi:diaminopimelate epimerase
MAGLPIPVGYERGKIAWIQWCGTGMHAHVVYWWDDEQRFQTLHPADRGGEA